jgi:phosphoribosyl-ATP pyrophosphohydrolase
LKINENNFIPASSQVLTQNKAEMALSIEGTKQNATVVCLKIKDRETLTQEHATQETIQKIINNAEKKGAITYESLDNLYFIFAPMKTKQLQNEVVALTLAKETERELYKHNKMFRQKIDSGISINSGQIVAKQTGRAIKFMSIGTFTTLAKKLADISKGELLLGEITNSRLNSKLKTKKESSRNVSYYSITEIKPEIDSKSFISNFVKKYEGN